jgi:hypothetical protein
MRPPFPRQHATFVRHPEAKARIIEGEDARHGILRDFFQKSFVRTAMKAAIAIVVSNDVPKGRGVVWSGPGHLAFASGVKIALPINLGSGFG